MVINELSKEVGLTNKEVIDFLKSKGFKVSSHMQTATNEMVDAVKADAASKAKPLKNDAPILEKKPKEQKEVPVRSFKKFQPDDMILCKSIVPWSLVELGTDRNTVYRWSGFGSVEYVAYKDLQAMRNRDTVRQGKILIEDPDICEQWRSDLGDMYKKFLGVEYAEEFFDVSDEEFKKMLEQAPDTFKEVIKYTAMDMIRNENYPTVQKIAIIDELLGTCIKDFL